MWKHQSPLTRRLPSPWTDSKRYLNSNCICPTYLCERIVFHYFFSFPTWKLPDFHSNLAFVWWLQLIKDGKSFTSRDYQKFLFYTSFFSKQYNQCNLHPTILTKLNSPCLPIVDGCKQRGSEMCSVEQFRCSSENTHQVKKGGRDIIFRWLEGGASLVFTWCTLPQILSINDWNREKEKCIPLRFRCDGRFFYMLTI